MKKRLLPLVLFLLLGILPPRVIQAQAGPVWHTFDALDGMTASWVFDIAQTADGTLWFATDQGVFRFDGTWSQVHEGLPSGPVLVLQVDTEGYLWAGTPHGVALWQNGAWHMQTQAAELLQTPIHTLLAPPEGGIWAGGGGGLFAWTLTDGWRRIVELPTSSVDAVVLDAQARPWLARGGQLYYRTGSTWETVNLGPENQGFQITDLVADPQRGVWAATQGQGIAHVEPRSVRWYGMDQGLPSNRILTLTQDAQGTLWAGTQQGIAQWDGRTWQTPKAMASLPHPVVSAVFQDASHAFWFGTPLGVTRYHPTWIPLRPGKEAPRRRIVALAYQPAGILWAAQEDGTLYRWQAQRWKHVPLRLGNRRLTPDITTLYLDAQQRLWMGTRDQGVLAWHRRRVQQWTMAQGLAENYITAIAQTPDGALWFGTRSAGLQRYDPQAPSPWQLFTQKDGLPSDQITALLADEGGQLWVGTWQGLAYGDGHGFKQVRDIPSREILALAQDGQGHRWAAVSEVGLFHGQGQSWDLVSGPYASETQQIEALMAVPHQVWMGYDRGLLVYDGLSWQRFGRSYGDEVDAVHALAGDAEHLYLGQDEGVQWFSRETVPPRWQGIEVNGQPVSEGEVTIDANDSPRVTLRAGDIHDENLLYLVQIPERSPTWQAQRTGFWSFPPLRPGDYHLLARVRDRHMNYGTPITITLHARPQQALVTLPGLGLLPMTWVLLIGLMLGLMVAMVGYIAWTTGLRWHMRQQAVDQRFNPYIAGSPVRTRDMFFGREKLLSDLKASVANNSMLLYGERRIGKTSLLYRLLDELPQIDDRKFRFFPVFVDLEGTPEESFFHQLMEGLLDALQEPLADFPAQEKLQYYLLPEKARYTDRHMRRDLRQIIAHLKKHTDRTPRILFLLDEADILSQYSSLVQQQFRRILQDVFARNVGAVLSGVYISKAWDRLESPWYNMFVEVIVPPLNRYEAELLMRSPVRGFYEWEDDAVAFVWQRSMGRPHRIQQLAREAVNLMLDEGRRRITLKDVRRAYERVVFAEGFRIPRPYVETLPGKE